MKAGTAAIKGAQKQVIDRMRKATSAHGFSHDYVESRVARMINDVERKATIPTPLHSHKAKKAIVKLIFDLLGEKAGAIEVKTDIGK